MILMVKKFFKFFGFKTMRDLQEEYLAKSTDLTDLERRLRVIQYKGMNDWV